MAETDKKPSDFNFLSDVLVPIVATLAAASGPYGQAGAQGLLGALNAGERRRAGRRDERRIDAQLRQQQQAFEAGQPQRDLAAAQAGFQLQNLGDIRGQVDAPAGPGVLGPAGQFRVQEALAGAEPIPTAPPQQPTPELRQQRFQQIAASPEGRAQLTAAGLGGVSQAFAPDPRIAAAAIRAEAMRQEKVADRQTEAGKRRFEIKKQAYDDLRQYPEDILPREKRIEIQSALEAAETDEAVLDAVKDLPAGFLQPKEGRIASYKFYAQYEREHGRTPMGPREFWNEDRAKAATRLNNITNVGQNGIDYGKPPPGHTFARKEDGGIHLEPYGNGNFAPVLIPMKGSEDYRKIEEDVEKKRLRGERAKQSAGIVVTSLNDAFGIIQDSQLPVTGLFGRVLAFKPGSEAFNLREKLETVRSRIKVDELTAIRLESPTGAALGDVSNQEGNMLGAVLGSLDQGQDKAQLLQNMGRIREIYLDIVHGYDRPDRQLQYLTQEDVANIKDIQDKKRKQKAVEGVPAPSDIKDAADLQERNLTLEQLQELRRRMMNK